MAEATGNGGKKCVKEKKHEGSGDENSIVSGGLKKKSTGIKLNIGQKRKTEQDESSNLKEKATKSSGEKASLGVTLAFASKPEKGKTETTLKEKKGAAAKAFGDESDSEEEEMPKEARMRMRNIGRDTPTSAGPNSYNKGKQGFTNRNKVWDRDMKPRTHLEKPPE